MENIKYIEATEGDPIAESLKRWNPGSTLLGYGYVTDEQWAELTEAASRQGSKTTGTPDCSRS